MSILDILPNIILYAVVGGGAAAIIWSIWRNVAPAAEGKIVGHYTIQGRFAGGEWYKEITGLLVDATASFLSPEVDAAFKEIIFGEIKRRNANVSEELLKKFADYPLSQLCRVLVTREGMKKHVVLQVQHLKPINEYALHKEKKFTVSFGFVSHGTIPGEIRTLSQKVNVPKLSRATIHLLIPDTRAPETEQPIPEWLPQLALFAPASVELRDLLKSYQDQLKDKDRKMSEMGQKMSGMATELDALRMGVKGFSTTDGKMSQTFPSKFDMMDFIIMAVPSLIGYYIGLLYTSQPIIGVIGGLLAGGALVLKRK